jgi:glucose-1-phosphate cytidylyltransferase
VNITELVAFHKQQEVLVTLTATTPPGRFGALALDKDQHRIEAFREKPDGDGAWINGGYFVVEPKAIDLIEGDQTTWEREPLEQLAASGNLAAYTLRDKTYLEGLWNAGKAPWKVWT